MIDRIERVMGVCERAFLVLANICLIIMLIGNMAQITTRAVFDQGIILVFPWTVFLFSWSVFFGFYVIYRQAGDITVDFFIDRLGDKGRKVSRYFVNAVVVFLMAIMLWHGPQTLMQQAGDVIEIVELDRWVQTLPLFFSCALVMVNMLLDTAKAMRGDPEPQSAHTTGDM
ncbi:MAG: TRAP transporter small permease subunit [Rhodospirillales bacterium]|jgi:TRAP-type C4-dicarboxylate transport system permease small subunit|nr:TRAP transporter small permease subunit [Rhodospirillales bacterium]MDP6884561.1 TRAP transporter small permease subunit [Rhodospirillales bacterium]